MQVRVRMASISDLDTSSSRYTVFSTKLQPPRLRTSLVARPRLIDRLRPLPDVKLAVIAAPAGFGKTTLVGQAVQQLRWNAAWLSLDEGDIIPFGSGSAFCRRCVLSSLRLKSLLRISPKLKHRIVLKAGWREWWLNSTAERNR